MTTHATTRTRHRTYMMDVMRRLEWDLHNAIELTDRIPEAWHDIACATPTRKRVKVNLGLDADVVRFFKSMGEGYGPRINLVLQSYMHARLAGIIKGAETVPHFRRRVQEHAGAKPQFGDMALDGGPKVEDEVGVKYNQLLQRRAGLGPVDEAERVLRVRF